MLGLHAAGGEAHMGILRLPSGRYQVTSLSIGPFFTITWSVEPSDAQHAQTVISELENRRVLWGARNSGDELHCLESAKELRGFLHNLLTTSGLIHSNNLRSSLGAMRAACLYFDTAGGNNGINFTHPKPDLVQPFSLALGELRSRFGTQVELLAYHYKLEIDENLAKILPPSD
jgi:hypothetical protein